MTKSKCISTVGLYILAYNHVGKTFRSSETRSNEQNTGKNKNSDCVKHLNDNFDHGSQWLVLPRATKK